MADSIDEIFGPEADPDELRAFYEPIGLSLEYECNTREMSVEIALEMATPTSKNEVGVALVSEGRMARYAHAGSLKELSVCR